MPEITDQQRARAERMWDAFGSAGQLHEAVLNGATRVRVRWQRPSIEAFGMVEARVPVVIALEHELPSVSRGDVLDLCEDRYAVIGIERTGLGRVEMRLEKQT